VRAFWQKQKSLLHIREEDLFRPEPSRTIGNTLLQQGNMTRIFMLFPFKIFYEYFVDVHILLRNVCSTVCTSVPTFVLIIAFENQVTPAVEDFQFKRGDLCTIYEEHIIDAVRIWCKRIRNKYRVLWFYFERLFERIGASTKRSSDEAHVECALTLVHVHR